MAHSREEVQTAVDKYIAVRDQICAGNGTWRGLAQFFTDDAVFIDPAWGRVEGIEEMKATVFGDAMAGLEEWSFPTEFYVIDGDNVVIKWSQMLPGRRENGSRYTQSGYSTLVYDGDGKFCYEEDLLNMVHVFEDMKTSGFKAPPAAVPPKRPDRDFSRPERAKR